MNCAYLVCIGVGNTVYEYLGAFSSYELAVKELEDYAYWHHFSLSSGNRVYATGKYEGRKVYVNIKYVPFRG